jgi:hypothetical protein
MLLLLKNDGILQYSYGCGVVLCMVWYGMVYILYQIKSNQIKSIRFIR